MNKKVITGAVNGQNLTLDQAVLNVAGSVNLYKLKIAFDSDWDNTDAILVSFSAAHLENPIISLYDRREGVDIPWEALQAPQGKIARIKVGAMGYQGTEVKITTTSQFNGNELVVLPANMDYDSAVVPTPDVVQTIFAKIGDLAKLDTEDASNLVNAINEVISKEAGDKAELEGKILAEAGARQTADETLQTAINGKQAQLNSEQLDAVNSGIDSTKVAQIATNTSNISGLDTALSTLGGRVTTVEGKIPTQATAQNQLADKAFVNSSISTNTANYISDNGQPFTSVAALEAYSGPVTNNDYAFVTGTDDSGNTYYDRYKATVSGATVTWAKEYRLNNSSFTAKQWAAVNSEITAELVAQISTNANDIASLNSGKQNKLTAGTNITIAGDTIEATDTTYTAGNGLSLDGTEFAADTDVLATKDDLEEYVEENASAGFHNSIYRGDNLLDHFTEEEIHAKIQSGDYRGMYIGDYIPKTVKVGNNSERAQDFVIAEFDPYLECGDQGSGLTQHHLLMIPADGFYETAHMNSTNTTTGGYYGSEMHGQITPTYTAGTSGTLTTITADYTTFLESSLNPAGAGEEYDFVYDGATSKWKYNGAAVGANLNAYGITYTGTPVDGDTIKIVFTLGILEDYRRAIYTAFGNDHILHFRKHLSDSTSASHWRTCRVELMNESMVYGQVVRANNVMDEISMPTQLAYFALCPNKRIAHRGKGGSRNSSWMASIVSGSNFCSVGSNGIAVANYASNSYVVRPFFLFS